MNEIHPPPLFVNTLFEDEFILAVSKPSGVPSHSLSDPGQITVELLIKQSRKDLPELQLLHRLDTGTSGILLFAKNINIYKQMRDLFKQKLIQKYYVAWSDTQDQSAIHALSALKLPHLIDLPLAHHPKSKKRMIPVPPGKKISYRGNLYPAQTFIHSAYKATVADQMGAPHILIEFKVQIITGVMHQIRVHLGYMGFPLVGDPIYGRKNAAVATVTATDTARSPRLGLHAERIIFELNGREYQIHDPVNFIL